MKASPDPRGRRRPWKALAVLLGTSVLLLAALEVGLRLSGDRRRAFAESVNVLNRRWVELLEARFFEEVVDPVRRYAMRPGAEARVDGWHFRANLHRARGPELPMEKLPGEKRMLALGDSFCFGLWADEDESLVAHLARLATDAAPEGSFWRPVNLGVPGYHSGQQLRALVQDGLPLEPDLVVVYFNTNDIVGEGFFLDESLPAVRSDHSPLPVGLRRALWHSHLYGRITRQMERGYTSRKQPHLDPEVPWAHVRADNQAATRAALAEIVHACRERDVDVFFVHQPLMTWSTDTWRPDWEILPLVQWAEGVREDLGIAGVNLLGWVRGNADGVDRGPRRPAPEHYFMIERYFADEAVQAAVAAFERGDSDFEWELPAEPDFHLTGEGYRHMAEVVYAAMRRYELVP